MVPNITISPTSRCLIKPWRWLYAVFFALFALPQHGVAQAPSISYNPATNVYPVGTAISPLTPVNSGGPVPATNYAQVTTLVYGGTLNQPLGITNDGAGNIYVADYGNNVIRKVNSAGTVTVLAGSGTAAEADGTGTSASFNGPKGIAYDGAGNLYVADFNGNTIRKIVIGTAVVTTYAGTGVAGNANGVLTAASFNGPFGMAFDAAGNLYVADYNNNLIRKIAGGAVSTLAGGGSVGGTLAGKTNATGTAASFHSPKDVIADKSGNLYVADSYNNQIRKIVISTGVVTTLAGSGAANDADGTGTAASFNGVDGLCVDPSGNVVVVEQFGDDVRLVTPAGVVTTIAGVFGYFVDTDGIGTAANFNQPVSITGDGNGNFYIGDLGVYSTQGTIRKMVLTGYTISPALPSGLSFNSTTGVISGTPIATSPATNYTITAYNGAGSSTTIVNIACGQVDNWTGFISTAWASASNWSLGAVPTTANGYIAQVGVVAYTNPNQPAVTASTSLGQIVFGKNNAPVLTIASGQTLTATSGITVNASASVTINGPGTISIGGASAITATGALTLSLSSVMSLTSGSALTNSGTFTLASDANGASSVASLPPGAMISGNVVVQRYLAGGAGHRGYRLLSSPVSAATDGYGNHIYSINYIGNSAYITGSGGTSGGFSKSGNPTLYLYRENLTNPIYTTFTGSNYRGINNLNASPAYTFDGEAGSYNIPAGNGYLFFFRGSTATANPYVTTTIPVAATLSATGTLNQGTINVTDWFTPSVPALSFTAASVVSVRGFNLLGNPYPCTINFEKFNRNGANSSIYGAGFSTPATIYFFNPVTKQYCSYKQKTTITAAADTSTSINPGTSSDGYASNMIASGEGFFIQTAATGETFSFRETAKISTQPASSTLGELLAVIPSSFRQQPDPQFRLRLVTDSVNSDEVVLNIDSAYNTNYDSRKDAFDLGGNGALESLSLISADSLLLCIHGRPLPKKKQEVIPLLVDAISSGTYQLKKIELTNLPKYYDLWLMDGFIKDSVEMTANVSYSFTIDKTNPATFGSARFALVLRENPGYAYHLLNFTATKVPGAMDQVQLYWTTENEQDYTNFVVERSTDGGRTFSAIGSFESDAAGAYTLIDKTPVIGTNLYRLKQSDVNHDITYSNIIPVAYAPLSNSLRGNNLNIYPNPVRDLVNLTINQNVPAPSYTISITNSSGQLITKAMIKSSYWQGSVTDLLPGTYWVTVTGTDNASFIGATKFVKL